MLEQAENIIESSAERIEYVKAYADRRITLFKISIIEAVAGTLGLIINRILLLTLGMSTLFFLSISAALYLGERWDSISLGFTMVGGFYLVLFVALLVSGGTLLRDAVVRIWSESLLGDSDTK